MILVFTLDWMIHRRPQPYIRDLVAHLIPPSLKYLSSGSPLIVFYKPTLHMDILPRPTQDKVWSEKVVPVTNSRKGP